MRVRVCVFLSSCLVLKNDDIKKELDDRERKLSLKKEYSHYIAIDKKKKKTTLIGILFMKCALVFWGVIIGGIKRVWCNIYGASSNSLIIFFRLSSLHMISIL